MHITFYTSALCPRCLFVRQYLQTLQRQYPQLQIESIDILRHPQKAANNGIRMIPTLTAGKERLTMLLPKKKDITAFLLEQGLS